VYSRADLSRSVVFVVAPFPTVPSTGAVACEFCAAGTQNEDRAPPQTPRYTSRLTVERSGTGIERNAFETATAGIYEKAMRDPSAYGPIERIRKVK
jgi:hypothetical protein